MLRLKETTTNIQLVHIKDNTFRIYPERDIKNIAGVSKDYKKNGKNAILNFPAVKTYINFIKTIRECTAMKIPGSFLVLQMPSGYAVFKSNMSSDFVLKCCYQPENQYMYDYIAKIFRMNDKKNYAFLKSTSDNHFAFVTTWQILQLILTKAYVESQGEEMFTTFKKPKKSGGMREIVAPNERIKDSLVDLNHLLQTVYDKRNSNFQIAYKKGKNVKSGALLHKDKKYVFNIDLSDFYPSCKKELVKRYTDFLFTYSYNRSFIENEFFDIILMNDGLFIGSPISGTLANAVISNAVGYMNNICKKFGMSLSVYADDISFSSDKFIVKDFVISLFNEAFAKYQLDSYYKINEKKCVGLSGCNRKVTGVTINNNDKITVSRNYYRNLRVQIDHLAKGDTSVDLNSLRGKIAYATMIDDSGKIYNYLNKYISTVKQYNLCSDEKLEELKERAGI